MERGGGVARAVAASVLATVAVGVEPDEPRRLLDGGTMVSVRRLCAREGARFVS